MKNLINAVSKISIAPASNILFGIIRTKVFAIILGTVGVGVISQLSNVSNLVIFVGSIGIPLGITRYVSEWEKEGKWTEIYDILGKSLLILILMGLIFLIITVVFSKQITFLILDSDTYSILLGISACAFPFVLVVSVFESFLRGLKKFDQYVKITVLLSVISLLSGIFFVIFFNLLGFALSAVFSSIISVVIYFYYLNKNKIFNLKNLILFDFTITDSFKSILKLGASSLILGIFEQMTLLSIRSLIIKNLGVELNGIYQCVVGISNNYFALFYMTLGAYILPVLSEMKDNDRMNDEINNVYRLTLLIIVPIITLTFILREYIIIIFYTSKFLPASDLMVFNFTGDFFKALAWVLGAWLIPRSKFRLWLIIGVLYNVIYFGTFIILTFFVIDIRNVVLAYAITGFIYFIVNLFLVKKLNNFHFRLDAYKLMFISTLFLSIIYIVSSYKIILGYIFVIPLFLLWLILSITRKEFHKLLGLIKLKR